MVDNVLINRRGFRLKTHRTGKRKAKIINDTKDIQVGHQLLLMIFINFILLLTAGYGPA